MSVILNSFYRLDGWRKTCVISTFDTVPSTLIQNRLFCTKFISLFCTKKHMKRASCTWALWPHVYSFRRPFDPRTPNFVWVPRVPIGNFWWPLAVSRVFYSGSCISKLMVKNRFFGPHSFIFWVFGPNFFVVVHGYTSDSMPGRTGP